MDKISGYVRRKLELLPVAARIRSCAGTQVVARLTTDEGEPHCPDGEVGRPRDWRSTVSKKARPGPGQCERPGHPGRPPSRRQRSVGPSGCRARRGRRPPAMQSVARVPYELSFVGSWATRVLRAGGACTSAGTFLTRARRPGARPQILVDSATYCNSTTAATPIVADAVEPRLVSGDDGDHGSC